MVCSFDGSNPIAVANALYIYNKKLSHSYTLSDNNYNSNNSNSNNRTFSVGRTPSSSCKLPATGSPLWCNQLNVSAGIGNSLWSTD